ncbi:leucine--tRNA ligase [archaeon CG10_big_fil_rev_8_21_14_0_10_43_11]|nr:MAG: leucine--tRNA ligase [archaeon CG10_big_fil_rev_8_21_14_0_10_43_11]
MKQTNDIRAHEKKWQKRWNDDHVFEAEPGKKQKFFITTPYPYISGSLHIGHARVVVEADVYSRFIRMRGKNTLFPMAFHITGTPVLGISLAIVNKDKEKTKIYEGYVKAYETNPKKVKKILESFKDPQNIVDFFIPKMISEYQTLGVGIDWRRSFTSGDVIHQKLVEWQFKHYFKKKFLVRGQYPVLYSKTLQNAVGEDDISEGDSNPVEKQEFILLKFKYGDAHLIAATLRPETMYGQTNLWVNPQVTYVKARVDNETWIISKECADKLAHQNHSVEIGSTIPGKDLIGMYCKAPVIERDIIILPSSFPDPDIGTGLVTSVPSDAPYDYVALKELQESTDLQKRYGLSKAVLQNISLIPIIKSKGYGEFPGKEASEKYKITRVTQVELLEKATHEVYKAGHHTGVMRDNCSLIAGMPVNKASEKIGNTLKKQAKASSMWETSRKAESRDGGKIIVAVLDNQWFLDFNADAWKDKGRSVLKQLAIQPEKYRKQFLDVFDWLDKRPCARKRGLGTRLPMDPQWMIESLSDSTIYMSLYPIAHKIREQGLGEKELTPDFFEYVLLGKGSASDASKKTGVKKRVLEAMRNEFDYWYPNDHRHTFVNHLPNHLSFSVLAHAAIFPKKYWPKKYSFHGLVISSGEKMSKSKGNVVTLLDVRTKYGADPFRAILCNTTSVEGTFNWETDEVQKMQKHMQKVYEKIMCAIKNAKKGVVQNDFSAAVSRIENANKKATHYLSEMNLREYSTIILYELMNIYSKIEQTKTVSPEFNYYIAQKWIPMLAPLVPHLAEELWEQFGAKGYVSRAAWPKTDEKKINPVAEAKERLIEQLEQDIKTVQRLIGKTKTNHITIITSESWKRALYEQLQTLMGKTKNPKEIMSTLMKSDARKHGKQVQKILLVVTKDHTKMPDVLLSKKEELSTLESGKKQLENVFGADITLIDGDKTDNQKKRNAAPMKPAILVE